LLVDWQWQNAASPPISVHHLLFGALAATATVAAASMERRWPLLLLKHSMLTMEHFCAAYCVVCWLLKLR
jgi:hypothetical protein